MNLRQLVAFFNSKNLTASANYFQGCAKDSVTLDGWIEEDFVKRHVGYGQTWKEVQANVTTIMQEEFKFTFETQDDQLAAELTGYIDSYDCVRMEVKDPQGGSIDFPVKNRESYYRLLTIHGNNIAKVYPTVHSYDIQDYQ
jgi:GH24 family phage-related lysozyme (muramidase)